MTAAARFICLLVVCLLAAAAPASAQNFCGLVPPGEICGNPSFAPGPAPPMPTPSADFFGAANSQIIVYDPPAGAPTDAFATEVSVQEDLANIAPGFTEASASQSFLYIWHGDHTSAFVPGAAKTTFIDGIYQLAGPAAGQRFALMAFNYAYGAGDAQAVSPFVQCWGGVQSGGDEGCNANAVEFQEPTANAVSTLQTTPSIGGGSTTTAQTITGAQSPQAVSVASTAGFALGSPLTSCPNAAGEFGQGGNVACEWVVVNKQANHQASGNISEAVALTAIGATEVTGVFRDAQSSGVTITPAAVVEVFAIGEWGEHRYLVDTAQPSYTTGTLTFDPVAAKFNGSGTSFFNSMVGGNVDRPGCVAPAGWDRIQNHKTWFAISAVNSPTQLTPEPGPNAPLPLTNIITVGGSVFNAGDVVTLSFTNSGLPFWPTSVSYTVGVDNASTIANGLLNAIFINQSLQSAGVTGKVNSAVITLYQNDPAASTTALSATVTGSGNETVTFSGGPGVPYEILPCSYVLRVVQPSSSDDWLILENAFAAGASSGDTVEEAAGPAIGGYGERIQDWLWFENSNVTSLDFDTEGGVMPTNYINAVAVNGNVLCPQGRGGCYFINGSFNGAAGQIADVIKFAGAAGLANVNFSPTGSLKLDNLGMLMSVQDNIGNNFDFRGGAGAVYELDATWNNSAVYHALLGTNVTDTASEPGSDLINFQLNGSIVYELNKLGWQRLGGIAYASLPASPVIGTMVNLSDGKAANCADSSCTTWGTAVTGGGGALRLLIFAGAGGWHLIGD